MIEFTPDKVGSYQYTCWMGMIRGTINVVEAESASAAFPAVEESAAAALPANADPADATFPDIPAAAPGASCCQ